MKLLFLFLFVWGVCAEELEYGFRGYKVYRTNPETDHHVELLTSLIKSRDLDFWSEPNKADLPVDIMVKPEDQNLFERVLTHHGMPYKTFVKDVQELIDMQKIGNYKKTRAMTWDKYYDLDDIYSWLDDLALEYPGIVTVINGGSTYEGRQIKGVKIALNPGKKIVFIEGGIHAREWISPATVTGMINEILTSSDPIFQEIAGSFEWHLFPSVNPDGYVYTHTSSSNRLWRKTRTPYGTCSGADPNRNWDAHWMEHGSSNVKCLDTYAGPKAFSEIETSTLSNYIASIASDMVVYLSFHSYSQLLLLPYGHTTDHLDNYDQMMQIGQKAIEALAQRYGTEYQVGNIAETIYLASGGSIDWVKQEFETPVVAAYELRDTGRYGFLLPSSQIIPNNEEVIDSLIAMLQEAAKFGYVTIG